MQAFRSLRMGYPGWKVGRWVAVMVTGLWASAVTAQEAAAPAVNPAEVLYTAPEPVPPAPPPVAATPGASTTSVAPAPLHKPAVPDAPNQPPPSTDGAPPVNPLPQAQSTAGPEPSPQIRFSASEASDVSEVTTPLPATDPVPDHLLMGPVAFGLGSVRRPESGALRLLADVNGQGSTGERRAPVPTIELRAWLGANRRVGIDLGFSYFESTADVGDTRMLELDAFYSRLGVPVALTTLRHSTLELIPQVGYLGAGGRSELAAQALFQWDLALRLVAETHFGFIGLPEFSVQTGVGMSYTRQVFRHRQRSPQGFPGSPFGMNYRIVGSDIGPFGGDGPWDMFLGNLAVLYYF